MQMSVLGCFSKNCGIFTKPKTFSLTKSVGKSGVTRRVCVRFPSWWVISKGYLCEGERGFVIRVSDV